MSEDFLQATLTPPPSYESPTRRRLAIGFVALAVVGVLLGITAFITLSRQPDYAPGRAAQAMCTRLAPDFKPVAATSANYTLPNVGRPSAVIVAPGCLKNKRLPMDHPNHYLLEVNVYVLVSHDQMNGLFSVYGPALPVPAGTPRAVNITALSHLLGTEQVSRLALDARPAQVNYFITDGPTPSDRLPESAYGYKRLTAPYDLLSGVRYASLPFRQAHAAVPAVTLGRN